MRGEGDGYTWYTDSSKWAVCAKTSIKRDAGATFPTEVGRMIPADLDEFAPIYSVQTANLGQRRYINYAGYGGATTTFANPITMIADDSAGGVVSYGLSTPVTYDHVMSKSSLVGLFMQMIASKNSLNLWGAVPNTDSVTDVRVGVTRWDQVQDISQQGWIQQIADEDDGELDTYFGDFYSDLDGADWYQDSYTSSDVFSFGETLRLRQPTQEMSGWDGDVGGAFESPIIRYPQVRAEYLEFDIDTTGLDFSDGPLYLSAQLVIGDWPVWINRSITTSDTTIRFEIGQLLQHSETDYEEYDYEPSFGAGFIYNEDNVRGKRILPSVEQDKSRIFDSRKDEPVQTPLLVTAIYSENPSTLAHGDVMAMMENLVFYDYEYLRMTIDNVYAYNTWLRLNR